MADQSFPNDAHNNRALTLAEHEQLAVGLGLSGLLGYTGTAPCFADSTGRSVKLRAGVAASIRGTRYNNTTEATIPISANTSGNTRRDLVVLRLRRTESALGVGDQYTVAPFVIEGTPAPVAVAPSPVYDDTPGAGFWDVPLAEVMVINGSVTITAAQCVPKTYYLSGSGYTGRDAWGKPPGGAGIVFRANDVGITYVGTAGGNWDRLYLNTGWTNITNGVNKAGWDFRNFAVARHGHLVVMTMYIVRTGGPVSATTHQYFGPVDAMYTPNRTVYGVAHISEPDHSTHTSAVTDGQILLARNNSQGISTGAQVLSNMTWLAD